MLLTHKNLLCELVSLARKEMLFYNHRDQMFSFECYDEQCVCVLLDYPLILQSHCKECKNTFVCLARN